MKLISNFWRLSVFMFILVGNASLVAAEQQFTWVEDSPASNGSRQHGLSVTSNGKLLLSWVEGTEPENWVRFSILGEKGWTKAQTIVRTTNKFAASPQVLSFANGSLAAAWMIAEERDGANIYLARSDDGGQNWSDPVIPYPAQARVYDAQMSLATLNNEELILVWTDTRNLKSNKRYQLMMGVIDKTGKIGKELTIDDDVCSCCPTSITAKGNDWLVAYRDRLPGDVRDISLARSRNGELTKKIVHNDNWVINGCPSNGPSVAWHGSQVMVTWFTAVDGVGRVRVAFSEDNGLTFSQPIDVDSNANGYVSALLDEDGFGIIAWRGRAGPEEELRVAKVSPSGKVERRTTLYRGDFPRWPSRHLKLVRANNEIYVAWTDLSASKVRLAKLPTSKAVTEMPIALNSK